MESEVIFSFFRIHNLSYVAVEIWGENMYVKEKQWFAYTSNDSIPSGYTIPARVYVHPGYVEFSSNSDIAIIEFSEDTDFGIDPVIVAKNYEESEGDYGIAAGYGYDKYIGGWCLIILIFRF